MSKYNLSEYENAILDQWLGIYKRSATTRILLEAVAHAPSHSGEIHEFISKQIDGKWSINEKSMYRTLRRLKKLELVDYEEQQTPKTGLKKKVYSITESGAAVLERINEIDR